MDIFDKYDTLAARRAQLLATGIDPFHLEIEELHGPCEATIAGRRTILLGTNNYLGLTFDPACIEAGVEALRRYGTGTTGSRIANGTYAGHRALEAELAFYGEVLGFEPADELPEVPLWRPAAEAEG